MRTPLAFVAALAAGCSPAFIDLPPAADAEVDAGTAPDAGAPVADACAPVTPAPREVFVRDARHVGLSEFNGRSQPWGRGTVFLNQRNEARYTDDSDPRDGVTGFRSPASAAPFEVMPRVASGCPGFFGASPYGTRAWVREGTGAWAFFAKGCSRSGIGDDYRGVGVARWDTPADALRPVTASPGAADPELLFGRDGFRPESAVLRVTEAGVPTLYAWDCHETRELSFSCRLGRVTESRVADASAWTFWTRDGWSTTGPGEVLFRSAGSTLTVTWNAALGRYLAVTGGWGADAVYYRTAAAPAGPWSAERVLFRVERPVTSGLWGLYANHHPGWDRDGGATVYVTYDTTPDNGATVRTPVVEVSLGLR